MQTSYFLYEFVCTSSTIYLGILRVYVKVVYRNLMNASWNDKFILCPTRSFCLRARWWQRRRSSRRRKILEPPTSPPRCL